MLPALYGTPLKFRGQVPPDLWINWAEAGIQGAVTHREHDLVHNGMNDFSGA